MASFYACRSLSMASPSFDGTKIVVACGDGSAPVFDAATGQNISFISGSGANGSPAFANNVLYTTEGSLVAAWTPGGFRPLWTAAPGGFGILQSSPAVVDGMLFVGSNSNTVVAYGLP